MESPAAAAAAAKARALFTAADDDDDDEEEEDAVGFVFVLFVVFVDVFVDGLPPPPIGGQVPGIRPDGKTENNPCWCSEEAAWAGEAAGGTTLPSESSLGFFGELASVG